MLYTDTVSKQVRRSYAAHAFSLMQRSMFERELLMLCAIWDGARSDKEATERDSIPAVIRLIDDEAVKAALVEETRNVHLQIGIRSLNDARDEDERKLLDEMFARRSEKFAAEQSAKAEKWLTDAIEMARETQSGVVLKAVRHLRDHSIAHVLARETYEKTAPERFAKYGDEKLLFETTMKVVDRLLLGVNGASFNWEMSREHEKRYAEAFWHGIRVNVLE